MNRASRTPAIIIGLLGLTLGALQACNASSKGETDPEGSGNNTATSSGSGGDMTTTSSEKGGGFTGSSSSGTGGEMECAETESLAEEGFAPADIILAVDTSGSMDAEAQWTQDNMNVFVQAIVGSGIDAHVVMISSTKICVPGSLGSGQCPADEKLPNYRHVQQGVGSTNAFEKILQTYPLWKDSLRANATKVIAVISDDDSDMDKNTFVSQLLALDPSFNGFKFDAIVASAPVWANPCLFLSADKGTEYIELVAQTGGVYGDLCLQNFGPVFQDMATAVITSSKVACVYDIPEPTGDAGAINYDKVNVDFYPNPNAPAEPIYFVAGGEAACGPNGGWYYDDPNAPTQIILCPASCTKAEASPDGKITVKFGCETLVGPPA